MFFCRLLFFSVSPSSGHSGNGVACWQARSLLPWMPMTNPSGPMGESIATVANAGGEKTSIRSRSMVYL